MPSTVQHPDGTSKAFELTEHDTFLLGRMADCHLCLPNDTQVSRHRFLLEACPPQASLRDLGSMNGTHVKPGIMLSRAQADTRAIARFKREMDVLPDLRSLGGVGGVSGSAFRISAFTSQFPYRFDPKRDPIDIILNENPVPIRERLPGLAKEIAITIDKSLVRNPKHRFPDAGKPLAAIRSF